MQKSKLRLVLLFFSGVVLTLFTGVFGSVFFRSFYKKVPPMFYYMLSFIVPLFFLNHFVSALL
ncbi:MAG: hypothetical protein D6797_07370, partial [Bdellovibrio sp.]